MLKNDKSIPIILGGGINGLGIARSFGEEGINSIVFEQNKDVAFYSKYSRGIVCPDPVNAQNDFLDYLIKFGNKLKHKGFLIATSDKFLIVVSRFQNILEKYYYFPMAKWHIIEKLINKEKLYRLASEIGIEKPKTLKVENIGDLQQNIKQITFPVLIKPSITIGFSNLFGQKAFIINTSSELKEFFGKISQTNFSYKPLIIQDYIPGSVENLYTITSYTNQKNKIIGYSIGYKIRQDPPFTGTITSGKIEHVPEILHLARKLLMASNFFGISNIEFKKDSRDGKYKLMEINPRSGVWNYSAKASGINLPLMAYKDFFGEKLSYKRNPLKDIIWVSLIDDFSLALFGFKKMGYPKQAISFREWSYSIRGKKTYAILNVNDMRPFIHKLYQRIKRKFNSQTK